MRKTCLTTGQIETITFGNGVVTEHQYDIRLRLKHLKTSHPEHGVLQDLTYIYDGVVNAPLKARQPLGLSIGGFGCG